MTPAICTFTISATAAIEVQQPWAAFGATLGERPDNRRPFGIMDPPPVNIITDTVVLGASADDAVLGCY